MTKHRIFVSATSRDLGNYRELASKTLRERGYVVDDQAIFSLTYHEIGEKLKNRIADCDAVVCLIGFIYGGEPSHRPPDQPRRSYTQWEFFLARALGKRLVASRAVGLANGSNPISVIVPCHRVIGSDGSLTGYGGGLERKELLLRLEGAGPVTLW